MTTLWRRIILSVCVCARVCVDGWGEVVSVFLFLPIYVSEQSSSNNNNNNNSKSESVVTSSGTQRHRPWIKKNRQSVTAATQTLDSGDEANSRAGLRVEEVRGKTRNTLRHVVCRIYYFTQVHQLLNSAARILLCGAMKT